MKMKPVASNQIVNDLMNHLTGRLVRIITDIVNTCGIAGVSDEYTIKLVMSCLMLELIKGAAFLELTEAEFIRLCQTAYREVYHEL